MLKIVFLWLQSVDAPQGLRSGLMPPLAPLTTPLFVKSCTVFQISLYLFILTSIFCNSANFNILMHNCACKCNRCSLERRLLSSQSEQFEKCSKSSDWLEKSWPSKKATFVWSCKPAKCILGTRKVYIDN